MEKNIFKNLLVDVQSRFRLLLLGGARGGVAARIRNLSKHQVASVILSTERGKNRLKTHHENQFS